MDGATGFDMSFGNSAVMEVSESPQGDSLPAMVTAPVTQVHEALPPRLPLSAFSPRGAKETKPKPALAPTIGNHRLGITWAHIAIIPTNSPIDAKAAASSTKTLNMTASLFKNVQRT